MINVLQNCGEVMIGARAWKDNVPLKASSDIYLKASEDDTKEVDLII